MRCPSRDSSSEWGVFDTTTSTWSWWSVVGFIQKLPTTPNHIVPFRQSHWVIWKIWQLPWGAASFDKFSHKKGNSILHIGIYNYIKYIYAASLNSHVRHNYSWTLLGGTVIHFLLYKSMADLRIVSQIIFGQIYIIDDYDGYVSRKNNLQNMTN